MNNNVYSIKGGVSVVMILLWLGQYIHEFAVSDFMVL